MPDHSVVHRYARCLSYPEWGVGSVNGIYFTGGGDDIQQWARVCFQLGVRTVPAGSLQFVDFSKPDPGAERVQRFMTAAKHALAEGDFALAARRLVYARDAEPRNTAVLRLMTLAFWQAGDYSAAARAVRDWAREERDRPAPYRYAARIYEDMGSLSQAVDAAEREVAARPATRRRGSGSAACACAPSTARARARRSSARARSGPSEQGLLDLALVANLMGDVGAEVTACEQATALAPESPDAWARYAHALARTDRVSDCLAACERALALAPDPEVRDLRERVRATAPRELTEGGLDGLVLEPRTASRRRPAVRRASRTSSRRDSRDSARLTSTKSSADEQEHLQDRRLDARRRRLKPVTIRPCTTSWMATMIRRASCPC